MKITDLAGQTSLDASRKLRRAGTTSGRGLKCRIRGLRITWFGKQDDGRSGASDELRQRRTIAVTELKRVDLLLLQHEPVMAA